MLRLHCRVSARRSVVALVICLAAAVGAPAASADDGGALLSPSPGTVFAGGPSYTIPVKWTAACQHRGAAADFVYHHWSVSIRVTRTAGNNIGVVGTQSIEYVGVNDSSKGPSAQGMVVTLADGAKRETFEVKLSLVCYGVSSPLGIVSVTVDRAAPPSTTTTSPGGSGGSGNQAGGGAGACVVPKLVGKTLGLARRLIVAAHCTVGRVRRAASPRAVRGLVVSQTPPPKTQRPSGAPVALVAGR